jgi:hypothetical protein
MTFPFPVAIPRASAVQIFSSLNPATKGSNVTLLNSNLTASNGASSRTGARSVQSKSSGKYYFEALVAAKTNSTPNEHFIGIATEEVTYADVAKAASMAAGVYADNATTSTIQVNGVSTGTSVGASSAGDRYCFSVDLDNGMLWVRLNNGNWNNSGTANPATNTGGFALSNMTGMAFSPVWATPVSGDSVTFNFGDSAFSYSVPSGFTSGWPQTPDASNSTGFSSLLSPNNANVTLSGGNLTVAHANTSQAFARSIHQRSTGKFYFEATAVTWANSNDGCGVARSTATAANLTTAGTNCSSIFRSGNIYANGSNSGTSLGAIANGDRIGVAIDLDNQMIWFRKNNGNWNNSGTANPATNTGGISISSYPSMAPHCSFDSTGSQVTTFNLGASAFTDTVPSGFTSGWPI